MGAPAGFGVNYYAAATPESVASGKLIARRTETACRNAHAGHLITLWLQAHDHPSQPNRFVGLSTLPKPRPRRKAHNLGR